MRLLILGPPGAGKGTQAARIAENLGIPAISTGDIFRANIKNETELGLQVKEILASGAYADEVRRDEEFFQRAGIRGVPAIIFDRKHLVSGGQPVEVFERVLREIAAGKA